jgi:hypothetical protein
MFEHWTGYNTMLPVFEYQDKDHLIDNIEEALLRPIERWEAGYDREKAAVQEAHQAKEALRRKDEEIARLQAQLAATVDADR